MADFLSTSVSGLRAFQRALDVTSHNIANVATPGYSRQRTEFLTREPDRYGNGWVGTGVDVSTVRRMYDNVLALQVRNANSGFARLDVYASLAERVNNLFGDSSTGLTASLQKFNNALQDLADHPTASASRQAVLSEAQALVDRFKTYESRLAELDAEIETRLQSEANEITTLARNIAELNVKIAQGYSTTGQPPNDLLDQRDRLIDELSNHINVNLVQSDHGQVNVFIGTGQPLVLGGEASQIVTTPDPYDPQRHMLAVRSGNSTVDITSSLTGGTLGGVLDFRREVLDPARNALGRIGVALTETFNEQHRRGMDLTGLMGGDLFSVGGVRTLPHTANTGSATLQVERSDVTRLTESDYTLELTSGGWQMRKVGSGTVVPLTGTGTAADPLRADGLEIVISGTANVGDRYLIQPTRGAIAGMGVEIDDPSRVAAAAPIRTAAASNNTGTGTISAGEVIDADNPALRDPVTIEFVTADSYTINGSGPFPYTSGDSIEFNGWSVNISGTPAPGDRFTVSDNSSGTGDNRNALKLAEVMSKPVLDNGTASLDASANRLVGNIGVSTRQAQASRDAQQVLQKDSIAARDSVSGVNLDEEAANLLRYQQAYQAAAQLVRIASTLFDTLISATRK